MPVILPHLILDTGPAPRHSVIWLHGLGADGHDFAPLAEALKLPVAVRFLFPHAPMQPVTINGGFVMRAWYDIAATDIAAAEDERGIRAAQQAVEALLAQEHARGVAMQDIYLAGFSQGAAITLHTGLRQKEALGGLIALSGYLPLAHTLPGELTPAGRSTPLFMAHGRHDPIVPYALGRQSAERLRALGCPVEWHDYGMEHSVCDAEVTDIERWLSARLAQ